MTTDSSSEPPPTIKYHHPTRHAIARHLAAAPKIAETDEPAIHCFVLIRGAQSSVAGSLSTTPEGGLRMLSPTEKGSSTFVEQFFDYEDVVVFAVLKEIQLESPVIVLPGSNRRS